MGQQSTKMVKLDENNNFEMEIKIERISETKKGKLFLFHLIVFFRR
jgi:hypothetical protein